jgi:hypothetical protein
MLMTFVMSWTGIAFASTSLEMTMPIDNHSQTNINHHEQSGELHTSMYCHDENVNAQHESVSQMTAEASCAQLDSDISKHQTHAWCEDCSIIQCQTQVCSLNVQAVNSVEMQDFNMPTILNFEYLSSQSSDFRQDILRPPQA